MSSTSNGSNGYGSGHVTGLHVAGHGGHNVVTLPTVKTIDPADAQMDQIRDLLFGEFKREADQRLAAMDHRIAALEQRLLDLDRRLAATRSEDEIKRKAMLDEIARGVASLGEHVKLISR